MIEPWRSLDLMVVQAAIQPTPELNGAKSSLYCYRDSWDLFSMNGSHKAYMKSRKKAKIAVKHMEGKLVLSKFCLIVCRINMICGRGLLASVSWRVRHAEFSQSSIYTTFETSDNETRNQCNSLLVCFSCKWTDCPSDFVTFLHLLDALRRRFTPRQIRISQRKFSKLIEEPRILNRSSFIQVSCASRHRSSRMPDHHST